MAGVEADTGTSHLASKGPLKRSFTMPSASGANGRASPVPFFSRNDLYHGP